MCGLDDMALLKNTAEVTYILEDIREMLSEGGIDTTIVPQIQWAKFQKNFWNVAFSSIATLSGLAPLLLSSLRQSFTSLAAIHSLHSVGLLPPEKQDHTNLTFAQ